MNLSSSNARRNPTIHTHLIGKLAITVLANDIVALDGMKPERYVDVYNINPDGSDKSIGKKRGRKPKSNCEMQIA